MHKATCLCGSLCRRRTAMPGRMPQPPLPLQVHVQYAHIPAPTARPCRSALACPWATAAPTPPSWPAMMTTSACCPAASSASLATRRAPPRCAWPCRCGAWYKCILAFVGLLVPCAPLAALLLHLRLCPRVCVVALLCVICCVL